MPHNDFIFLKKIKSAVIILSNADCPSWHILYVVTFVNFQVFVYLNKPAKCIQYPHDITSYIMEYINI